jgi:hypothetical protein
MNFSSLGSIENCERSLEIVDIKIICCTLHGFSNEAQCLEYNQLTNCD